ncbi:MAG TPA: amidohydrolase family protein [Bryobacteraceae bacterium]|jgi:N-acyl-D-aspartate/D-glutamate deacylase|nr:amidohydrolase family protein [Bryobacteraceae bacterium]
MMIRICAAVFLFAFSLTGQTYDTVLANGRVMDPESGLDAVRYIGIRGRRIEAISETPLQGKIIVDVRGLVVAPGFIDLHSHGQDDENYHFKAHDGVTTALELEIGVSPVAPWYQAREGKALINFGASSGHVPAKMAVMHDTGDFLPRDHAVHDMATDEQKLSIVNAVRQGLDDGGMGIGFGIAYVPSTTREEILRLFQLGSDRHVPVFVHMRGNTGLPEDGAIPSVQEVVADAAATGVSLHIVHITSSGGKQTANCLKIIEGARKHGVDVSTEMYPYTASATRIESALFEGDWQKRSGQSYGQLQWVATGERLTADTFEKYRKQGGAVINHGMSEETVRLAIANPMVMIASDGRITNGKGHPRSAGTFARVLGVYVREQKALSLMDALRKMTLMPAQRLEASVPAMRDKGRIRVGADADIVVFNPEKVIDKATFENAAQYSEGIENVMVSGVFVLRNGNFVSGAYPGAGLRTR